MSSKSKAKTAMDLTVLLLPVAERYPDERFMNFLSQDFADIRDPAANVAPVSANFTVDDSKKLAEFAAEPVFKTCRDDNPVIAAPLHALHALLRVGKPAAPAAMPILAKYAITLEPGGTESEFSTELLCPTLEAVFHEFGREAVPSLLLELKALETDTARLRACNTWLGLSVVADSLVEIVFEASDPALAAQVGLAFLSIIRAIVNAATSRDTYWNVASALASVLEPLKTLGFMPEIRTAETLALLRRALQVIHATGDNDSGVTAPGWAEICACFGVDPVPGDPLIRDKPIPGTSEVAEMWRTKHPKNPTAEGVAFPGSANYVMPSGWISFQHCASPGCGMDLGTLADMVAAVQRGEGYDEKKLIEALGGLSKGFDKKKKEFKACSACKTVLYCSAACQTVHWSKVKRDHDPSAFDVEIKGPLLRLADKNGKVSLFHRPQCKLRKKVLALTKA